MEEGSWLEEVLLERLSELTEENVSVVGAVEEGKVRFVFWDEDEIPFVEWEKVERIRELIGKPVICASGWLMVYEVEEPIWLSVMEELSEMVSEDLSVVGAVEERKLRFVLWFEELGWPSLAVTGEYVKRIAEKAGSLMVYAKEGKEFPYLMFEVEV